MSKFITMKNFKHLILLATAMIFGISAQAQKEEKAVYQFTDDVEAPHTIVQNQANTTSNSTFLRCIRYVGLTPKNSTVL